MSQFDFIEDEPTPAPEPSFDLSEFRIRQVRRKPLQVEAALVTTENLADVVAWIESHDHAATLGAGQLIIQTLEGPFTVRPGQQVVRGTAGEFYPMEASVFAETMDELE